MKGTYRGVSVGEEDAEPDNARLICALGRLGHDSHLVALRFHGQHDTASDVHSHLEIYNSIMLAFVINDKIFWLIVPAQLTEEVIVVCKDIFFDLFRSSNNLL